MPSLKIVIAAFILFSTFGFYASGQVSVGSANTPPDPSAMLDIKSTDRGVLFPRMSSLQRRNIANPAAGLVVYDSDRQALYLYTGQMWKAVAVTDISTISTAAGFEAGDGVAGDAFAINVRIFGNYAVAGAYNDDIGSNADQGSATVYKFENGGWLPMQKLVASDGAASDFFGGSMAMDSGLIIIGAYGDDVGENINQGSAYVFKLESGVWVQKQKLTSPGASNGDAFGSSLSISNGSVVITAYQDDIGAATDAGSAYVFKLNDSTGVWTETQKFYPNDGTSGDAFGNTVCMKGDKMIVTAFYDDVSSVYHRGSAYIYTFQSGSWVQTAKLVAADGQNNDVFGTNAAILGDFALVGAYNADGTYANQGACYLFKLEGGIWVQKQKIFAVDATTNGFFGQSVAMRDNYAIVGAHGVNGLMGAAYILQLNPATSNLTQLQKITPLDGASNDYFGFSSDIHNGNVVIGAYGKNSLKGKVYFKSID